jgi:glycosyltransferase involved in cell wall biosynthesis
MVILHVLDHHIRYNGMAHAAVDLACAQAGMGHKVALVSAGGSFNELLAKHGVEVFDIPLMSGKVSLIPATVSLWNLIGRYKPDVLHAHMIKAAMVAAVASRLRRVPLITCVQNSFSRFAHLMKVGDRVITGCRVVADDMEKRGVSRQKLRPILNGTIGSARQAPSDDETITMTFKHPAITTASGMHRRKGVPDLIEGFQLARKTNPSLNLYIFGEGPNLEEFRQMVNAENKDAINFCEPVPNVKPYFQQCDAFVLASLADPAPLIISEAREAGLAILATRVDGIPEMLEEGRAGILIDPKAPEQIAEQLVFLFSDPAHLATWRENSQYRIDRLTVDRVAEQSVEVYREVARVQGSEQGVFAA